MSKAVISAQGIEKSFGPLDILKGLSIEVYEREIVAVVGASGTGKTTLLQILGTLDSPDGGSVRINGTDVVTLKGDEQARFRNKHIGFVFQFHQILPELTALENVAIPALIAGVSKKDAYAKAEELLRYLNMGERLHHKPAALSGGEKQRVAVGRALINNPTVILADEPSGALDKAHKEELHSLFLKLREEKGLTFVIVTHDDALTKIADRTVRLADGICQ